MSSFLGFDPNDPLGNNPTGGQGGLTWQALGGMPQQMWDGMNVWDKISFGTGVAAPFTAAVPPLAAGLTGISAATGLLGAGQSVYEDPSAFNIGANLAGVTPWSKLAKGVGGQLGIYVPPASAEQVGTVKDMELMGKSPQQVWGDTGRQYGTPLYRHPADGQLRMAISDADAAWITPPGSIDEIYESFPETMDVRLVDEGVYDFSAGLETPNAVNPLYEARMDMGGGVLETAKGSSPEMAKYELATRLYRKQTGELPDWTNPRSNDQMTYRLGDIMQHDKLFDYNPDLADINVKFDSNLGSNVRGEFNPMTGEIRINPSLNQYSAQSTLLHELQHAIQARYNMQPGYNTTRAALKLGESRDLMKALEGEMIVQRRVINDPAATAAERSAAQTKFDTLNAERVNLIEFQNSVNSNPENFYKQTVGETEARLTQEQRYMDPQDLRTSGFPGNSAEYGLLKGPQIVLDRNTSSPKGVRAFQPGSAARGLLASQNPANASPIVPMGTPNQSSGAFDDYLDQVNPGRKTIADVDRPNLMMGDMYGMLPRNSERLFAKGDVDFYRGSDGNFYATAYNPDLGEQDVVGYIAGKDNYTDLAVVEEMRNKGIGSELQYLFRSANPYAPSGGLTAGGQAALQRTYERMAAEGLLD